MLIETNMVIGCVSMILFFYYVAINIKSLKLRDKSRLSHRPTWTYISSDVCICDNVFPALWLSAQAG